MIRIILLHILLSFVIGENIVKCRGRAPLAPSVIKCRLRNKGQVVIKCRIRPTSTTELVKSTTSTCVSLSSTRPVNSTAVSTTESQLKPNNTSSPTSLPLPIKTATPLPTASPAAKSKAKSTPPSSKPKAKAAALANKLKAEPKAKAAPSANSHKVDTAPLANTPKTPANNPKSKSPPVKRSKETSKASRPQTQSSPIGHASTGNKRETSPSGFDSNALLNQHNQFRAKHQADPLSWDPEMASTAQAFAEKCVFKHSSTRGVGENIYQSNGSPSKAASEATTAWYDEVSIYNFNYPGFSMATGHFTQVVWKATKKLGCGIAACGGKPFVVCQYFPAGNMGGQFPKNVVAKGNY